MIFAFKSKIGCKMHSKLICLSEQKNKERDGNRVGKKWQIKKGKMLGITVGNGWGWGG